MIGKEGAVCLKRVWPGKTGERDFLSLCLQCRMLRKGTRGLCCAGTHADT